MYTEKTLYQKQRRNSGDHDPRDNGDHVFSGELRRGDAADGGNGNHAPGDDGAAAHPDGGELPKSGKAGGIKAGGGGEGSGDGADQRKSGEAGTVKSGDDADQNLHDDAEDAVYRYVVGDEKADVVQDGGSALAEDPYGVILAAQEKEGGDDQNRREDADGENEALLQIIHGFA